MAEDKARDRRESLDSGRERNAVIRSQGPDADRMGFFNGLPGRLPGAWCRLADWFARVKPRAYQEAVPYLRKVRDVLTRSGRKGEWEEYLAALRQHNKRRPRCLEELDRLQGDRRRIVDG